MSEYRILFDARGGRYNRANRLFPQARAEEADRLLAHCGIPDGAPWLDVGAGGGFLAERAAAAGLSSRAVGCDESPGFLAEAGAYAFRTVAAYGRLPFADGVFAASACLAVLHHAETPRNLLGEMLRVTGPRGRAAVGDVAAGSAASRFLNRFVDEHTPDGHTGRFYDGPTLAAHLAAAGGRDVRFEEATLAWRFPEARDARTFCRELFGLRSETPDGRIEAALAELGLSASGGVCTLPWTMVFASASP